MRVSRTLRNAKSKKGELPITHPTFAIFNYPERKDEIIKYIKAKHFSRRCPAVWKICYALLNPQGKIQAVSLVAPPPYPSIARKFTRRAEDIPHVAWQSRMMASGITSSDLDYLLQESIKDLTNRGYYWLVTLTDPVAKVIDGGLRNYVTPGHTGETYIRNNFLWLGWCKKPSIEGWLIDGTMHHCRKGKHTITQANVRTLFPHAKDIRPIRGNAKGRFACVLAHTEKERAERTLLMSFRPQTWDGLYQPRLLFRLKQQISIVLQLLQDIDPLPKS